MPERWSPNMVDERESDRQPPEITWCGPLNGGYENINVWRGKISAKLSVIRERFGLASDEAARNKLDRLKDRIKNSYVVANLGAVVRCVDGRGEEDAVPNRSNLGPQVPGGTAVTSLAYRFALGLSAEATIESDVEEYRRLLEALGLPYIPGGHEDEHNANDPENTGCSAIDKLLEILKIMGEYDMDEHGNRHYIVYDYAEAIAAQYMNKESFERAFQDIQVKLQALNGPHFRDHYFQKEESTDSHRFRTGMLNKVKEGGLRHGRRTVERLCGDHNEAFLMVNYVAGETFDRDGFAADSESEGKIQAFNYDVWVIAERARDVFRNDVEKQYNFMLTNIMYAVGTAMALTDGSLELGIRQ
jgi:hypothetical protein